MSLLCNEDGYVCTVMCILFFAATMMKAEALSLSDLQLVSEPIRGKLIAEVHHTLKNSEVGMISLSEIQGERKGCAIAQAGFPPWWPGFVSGQACGVCGGQSGTEAGFL
jgi:hypothetical protein